MASPTDLLTAAQNLVQAVNSSAQTFLRVHGNNSVSGITSDTYVQGGAGRLCKVSVVVGGTAGGTIYDAQSASDKTRPLYYIPPTPGLVDVDIAVKYGILVSPGAGQTVSVGYS